MLATEAVASARARYTAAGRRLDIEVAGKAPIVLVDRQRLAEALANLLDNALPALCTGSGPVPSHPVHCVSMARTSGMTLVPSIWMLRSIVSCTMARRNWSRGGGVPGVLAGEAVERVEHGDAVLGGGRGVGADGGEVFRAFHGAHAAGYLLPNLDHADLLLCGVVREADRQVGGEA